MIMTTDDGALEILEAYFKTKALSLRAFTNNITPADDDVLADYTEAAGGGYAAIALAAADWTGSITNGIAQVTQAMKTFTFTGPLTGGVPIYGYYVVNPSTNKVIYAELLAEPITPANDGDVYNVIPTYKLSKGTPT